MKNFDVKLRFWLIVEANFRSDNLIKSLFNTYIMENNYIN